jgi:hypothetical protein
MPIAFKVVSRPHELPASGASQGYLLVDNWDDRFKFTTLYVLTLFDRAGVRHEIGQVKIGQFGMQKNQPRAKVPDQFFTLSREFFSLGQDSSYYRAIHGLDHLEAQAVLDSLRDVVADDQLFKKALKEEVTTTSLLRSVSPSTVQGQFRRVLAGGTRLTPYNFTYAAPGGSTKKPPPFTLSFEVQPDSNPPTNIHVLIGRNGVGKTYVLNRMTRALTGSKESARVFGKFEFGPADDDGGRFANLVSTSFSAFDPFQSLPEKRARAPDVRYSYVGLKRRSAKREGVGTTKSLNSLAKEFVQSAQVCMQGKKKPRWQKAIQTLETDPNFGFAGVGSLTDFKDPELERFQEHALGLFKGLSSGHKVVLLTITRLVETVEERTLVLFDEPEAHLHPPLLSALVRAVSDLLIDCNGVAIIATHSPVVLQEVPKSCVWKLRRAGTEARAERPQIETFGENVGILTQEVFGLEVTHAGFHKLLQNAAEAEPNFEMAVARFQGHLGAEARSIVQALMITKGDSQ